MIALSLSIAGIGIEVKLPNPYWVDPLISRYKPFVVSVQPEWRIVMKHEPDLPRLLPGWIEDEGERTRFHVIHYRGWLDPSRRRAEISAPRADRALAALDRLVAFLLMRALPVDGRGLLVHGCGIEVNGWGHLFFGPSGAGKSTLAALSTGMGTILSDESVCVVEGSSLHLYSTPIWGQSTPSHRVQTVAHCPPLRALYTLRKGASPTLRRLGRAEVVLALLAMEKVEIGRASWLEAWYDVVEGILDSVPAFELTFARQSDFWSVIGEQGLLHSFTNQFD